MFTQKQINDHLQTLKSLRSTRFRSWDQFAADAKSVAYCIADPAIIQGALLTLHAVQHVISDDPQHGDLLDSVTHDIDVLKSVHYLLTLPEVTRDDVKSLHYDLTQEMFP